MVDNGDPVMADSPVEHHDLSKVWDMRRIA